MQGLLHLVEAIRSKGQLQEQFKVIQWVPVDHLEVAVEHTHLNLRMSLTKCFAILQVSILSLIRKG